MLTLSSKHLLRDLLVEIGKEEKQLEVLRQILCEQYDFEPYASFRRIDRTRKGFITNIDILEFLLANDQRYTESECSYFVSHYDRDGDGKLAYLEFLPSLLPLDNPELRATATQRKVYDVEYDELLPYEVEYALSRLIAKEISFYKELDGLKAELASEYDFTYLDAFSTVDIYETGFVDYYNLKNFLKNAGKKASEDLLIAILRRLDKDDDGRINYEEFMEGIQPQDPTLSKNYKKKPKKTTTKTQASGKKSVGNSPTRTFKSPLRTTNSPRRTITEKDLKQSQTLNRPKTSTTKRSGTPGRNKSAIIRDNNPEDYELTAPDAYSDLIKVFREVIVLEREIEFAKQDLALRNDFNPFDAFRFFDTKGKTFVSVAEIEHGFADLGIFPNREDIYLFIRRFDKQGDGKLRFGDFVEVFTPVQQEYYKLLKQRTPINGDLGLDAREIWTQSTIRLLKNLIILHLENEAVVEALRQKLSRDKTLNLKECFELLDDDGDGFMTVIELRIAMDKENVFVSEKDVVLLINRFDKDEDQKVSYVEFIQEITPKSKKKY